MAGLDRCREWLTITGSHSVKGKAMTDVPKIAQKAPYKVEMEAGKTYFWCACGESKNQPFCDGSHKGGAFVPLKVTAEETKTAYLCGCKQSKNGSFCDGTHKGL